MNVRDFTQDAHYECCNCGYRWWDVKGPQSGPCPKCGSLYYKWLNYEVRDD